MLIKSYENINFIKKFCNFIFLTLLLILFLGCTSFFHTPSLILMIDNDKILLNKNEKNFIFEDRLRTVHINSFETNVPNDFIKLRRNQFLQNFIDSFDPYSGLRTHYSKCLNIVKEQSITFFSGKPPNWNECQKNGVLSLRKWIIIENHIYELTIYDYKNQKISISDGKNNFH